MTVHTKMLCAGRAVGIAGALAALASVLACGGDVAGPGVTPSAAYWALQLNQHAVTLALTAPYDTIQLSAVPLNVLGQPLAGLGSVHYSTEDSLISVDSTGLVTAKLVTQPSINTTVVASLTDTVQHVTLVDTCFIQVTVTAPSALLDTFYVHPANPADTVVALSGTLHTLRASATDAAANSVPFFPYFTSSDSTIAAIDRLTGVILAHRQGQVTLYATTWSYGVAKQDSFLLQVGPLSAITVQVYPVTATGSRSAVLAFWPQVVTIGAEGVVTWSNPSLTDSADVVFDDPTNVDSAVYGNVRIRNIGSGEGNIAPWVKDTAGSNPLSALICTRFFSTPPKCNNALVTGFTSKRLRKFTVPGTYHYHSVKWGTTGTIVVQP